MSQYKVLQDIEAEDKLLGPFSLRQFIYAGGAVLMGYLSYVAIVKGVPFLLLIFVPPMLFCMFFAWPWSPDQPTEVWALARIRFMFKTRRRIWDQSGARDLVTITAPKQVERTYTNGLSQSEVRSRLAALADTIDSRGWAVKNSNVNMPALPSYDTDPSDRLVASSALPQVVGDVDVQADDDILDEQNNPVAQQFDHMMQESSQAHRQRIINQLNGKTPPAPSPTTQDGATQPDYWFLHEQQAAPNSPRPNADNVVFANPQVVHPGTNMTNSAPAPTPDEEAIAQQALQQGSTQQQYQNMHLRTINPLGGDQPAPTQPPQATQQSADQPPQQMADDVASAGQQPVDTQVQPPANPPVTPQPDPAILNLASSNDLDVATLARQAQRSQHPDSPDDEVVISLR